jgi:DNA repair protein RadD
MRVIGLTASPYRLGHGYITDKPALFDDIIAPVTISELIARGFLAPLRSKITKTKLATDGVHKRGGEYIESELQKAVDTKDQNVRVVREIIELAADRKAWLLFCTGVHHAQHIAEVLNEHGISAACVTGDAPKKEREQLIDDFRSGRLRALTNANVLTTGFDYPDIDLIAMLRPTMSPSLYIQMAGRGMRIKSHTDHCLVLDFAGVVEQHGPIVNVRPPKKAGEGDGVAPVKPCPECSELVHISAMKCPSCGFIWPPPEPKKLKLHDVDIMGESNGEMQVGAWKWSNHVSQAGNEMVKLTYYGLNLSDPPVTEYFAFNNGGYAAQMAIQRFAEICRSCGVLQPDGLQAMNNAPHPKLIKFRKDGKFYRVTEMQWTE